MLQPRSIFLLVYMAMVTFWSPLWAAQSGWQLRDGIALNIADNAEITAIYPGLLFYHSTALAEIENATLVALKNADGEAMRDLVGVPYYYDNALSEQWLREGRAVVRPNPDLPLDWQSYSTVEANARQAGRGLWQIQDADWYLMANDLTSYQPQKQPRYMVFRGIVREVKKQRSGTIFINFGEDWHTDATAMISKADARAYFSKKACKKIAPKPCDPLQWEGAELIVRGWVVDYRGPSLRLRTPLAVQRIDSPPER